MDSVVPSQAQREPHSDLISLVTVVARKLSVEPFPVLCVQDNEESSLSSGLMPQLHLEHLVSVPEHRISQRLPLLFDW